MATAKFLLQAVTKENHANAIKWIIENEPEEILFSVAFARAPGVGILIEELKKNSQKVECFVGIRNDITSYQALEALLSAGVKLFVVDTGSRNTIFHPKVYISVSTQTGRAVIGSSNMTFGGLLNNIEASTVLELFKDEINDKTFINDTLHAFHHLKHAFPEHVIEISSIDTIDMLLSEGRITDETASSKQPPNSERRDNPESVPLMPLYKHSQKPTIKRGTRGHLFDAVQSLEKELDSPETNRSDFYLVWQSNELTERDLNIPSGANTNRTGSMLWKKGAVENIDQRHFFREEVFRDVPWERDVRLPHYERALATFRIYTKGVFRGEFLLRISHNSDTESLSYAQNNSMTSVSWGNAREVICKRDLLGRRISLSRDNNHPPKYLIEID